MTNTINQHIQTQRNLLATAATEANHMDLASIVNNIAKLEGRLYIATKAQDMEDNGATHQEIINALTKTLLNGANDDWTGRGNDTNRAHFDGIIAQAKNMINGYLLKMENN